MFFTKYLQNVAKIKPSFCSSKTRYFVKSHFSAVGRIDNAWLINYLFKNTNLNLGLCEAERCPTETPAPSGSPQRKTGQSQKALSPSHWIQYFRKSAEIGNLGRFRLQKVLRESRRIQTTGSLLGFKGTQTPKSLRGI